MEKEKNIKLSPTSVILARWINGTEYKFAVDGYVDQDGELYYKASEVSRIDNLIKQTEESVEETKKAIMEGIKNGIATEIMRGSMK